MNEVVDRVPSQPGRYKMTMPDGSTQYVTLERADEPTVVGTPLNKALFDSIQDDLDELNSKLGRRYSLDDMTEIPANANFNNYNDFGNFCYTGVNASTFSNFPTKYRGVGGVLRVERSTYAIEGFCRQTIMTYNGYIAWRVKISGAWNAWVESTTSSLA